MQITCIPGGVLHANTFVLRADHSDAAIIIDPTDAHRLEQFFQKESLRPVAVLLTHGHFDHTSGVAELQRRYTVPVYLHPDDAPMLDDPERSGLHVFFPGTSFEPIGETIAVSDGQTLALGGLSCQVLSTPGHSKGSVCYLFVDILFSGDTLFRGGYGRTDLWGGNGQTLIASLRRLMQLDREVRVYPGHGDPTVIAQEFSTLRYY